MKPNTARIVAATVAACAFGIAAPSAAEDIDLFTSSNSSTNSAPNVLIIIDNSANWSRNDQQWDIGKQGQAELNALWQVLNDGSNFKVPVNMGLMLFNSNNGGSVRFAIRPMDATDPTSPGGANRKALMDLIGTDPAMGNIPGTTTPYGTCTDGTDPLTGTKRCILKNFDSPQASGGEKVSSASTDYSGALFEAFKYFGGYTDPAHANLDQAGTPVNSTHFGQTVYTLQSTATTDQHAYTGSGATAQWVSPIGTDGSCAKNYIIFIGNGYPSQDAATSLITGINGSATVPPGVGNKGNHAANWTKYLNQTDVSALLGRQNVTTYAINVFNVKEDANQTLLLNAMALYGGTQQAIVAKNTSAILQAMKDILVQIQSVNSVFASASLPINATNRTQNENQVFIGVFRPDPSARPKWYGNLKEYKIAMFGQEANLADSLGQLAVSASTGFIQPCAVSFWTTDSGSYWSFSAPSAGTCTTVGAPLSDYPDGGIVEKGGVAEVLRKGNSTTAAATGTFAVNRNIWTCTASPCTALTTFDTSSVTAAATGAPDNATNTNIVNFTRGQDVRDENGNNTGTAAAPSPANAFTEPRPSIHGDLVHSRPLPINFGGTRGVELFYGSNDGSFRAVSGTTGQERWAFIAPEHWGKLKRLYDNAPLINYPNIVGGIDPPPTAKDYFFDGSTGVYQNADNSKVWIFPSMRRGGRMLYGFDVTNTGAPVFKWAVGCPNLTNDTGCTSGMTQIGLTFSLPSAAFVKGYNSGTKPVIIVGGGYDKCEDTDAAVTTCTSANKGNVVYVLDADTGRVIKSFATSRAVAADPTLIDRDFDGLVDHAYIMDIGGSLYRIDFSSANGLAALGDSDWTITKIAQTAGGNRKFLFGPSALAALNQVFLAVGSGDRERPLISNYPYTSQVQNRFYMFIDKFATTGLPIDLDGSTMSNFSSSTDCSTTLDSSRNGWFMDLSAGRGEQSVTSSVIFGGTVFFSTNRPVASAPGTCSVNLGEARGYAVNLLNASGVIGTGSTCGGARSGVFTGGGIPPSPVVGTVPVVQADGSTKTTSVLIGGIDLKTGTGSPIGAQKPPVPVKQIRQRIYWYPEGNQ